MGFRSPTSPTSPASPRQYQTFLNAQESSATLVLAHAKIGDSGAQEVAEFASRSAHLRLLDLTGCDITSNGLLHIAQAVRCSLSLESLVLRHNEIMSGPAGEEGLAALCQAAASSASLRHLDLRYCGVQGEAQTAHIASILQGNAALSHLELSWNLLEASGGQVLRDSIRMTSGLFDCQLSGCRLADETLQEIAELLLRNRKAHKASTQAGPYKGSWVKNTAELEVDGQVPATPTGMRSQGQASAANLPLRYAVADIPGNAVVSEEKTLELTERLFELRDRFLPESSAGGKIAQIHEFMEYLQKGQADSKENQQAADEVLHRTDLIMQGFQDRELRYREKIARDRDDLLSYSQEYSKLQGNLRRSMEDLSILREDLDLAKEELKRFQRNCEEDEHRDYSTFVAATSDRKELERRLRDLQDRGHHLDIETKMLRNRAEQVRERVANEIT